MMPETKNPYIESNLLPVDVVFHPSWWHQRAGIVFDEDFFYHPAKRVDVERRMEKELHDRFGKYGLGQDRKRDLPVIGAVHNAAGYLLSEMLGCQVLYKADAAPQVIPAGREKLEVAAEEAFRSRAFKRFRDLLDNLKTKFGYVTGDINWGGVLNVALDLAGENVFLGFFEEPEGLKRQFREIARVMEAFTTGVAGETGTTSISVNRTVRHIRQPVFLHSECSHTMISAAQYEEFLLPIDADWSRKYRPFGIHYCGKDPHRMAGAFGKIENLDFVDVGWGGDVKKLRASLPRTFLNLRLDPVALPGWTDDELSRTVSRLVEDSGNPYLTGICCINLDDRVDDAKIATLFKTVEDLRRRYMKNSRREFMKTAGLAGLSFTGTRLTRGFSAVPENSPFLTEADPAYNMADMIQKDDNISVIGLYGQWAASLTENKLPSLSFRNREWTDRKKWHAAAEARVRERLAIPDVGGPPEVTVKKQYTYDGLHIEELSWRLPYGRPTDAIFLKPADAEGALPGILAFHDHGGLKYFGTRKITRTSDDQHPLMRDHQKNYYSGRAWANEIAKRGYAVLVPDAFPFASRRVMMQDVPESLRNGLNDDNPEDPKNIEAYNAWAANHESVMAKSLFCAGTTWPGVFFAEDRIALDILSARPDVARDKIGCGGLSGGGMRTVFAAGLDSRIQCAVPVGFMTTWKDFCVNKSYTHTWMTYVPILPNELDFPEILSLRIPLPALVLNNTDDELFTLPEMNAADKILREVYAKAGAADKYKCSFCAGPHKFDAAMQAEAFSWFDRWLK